MLPEIFKRYNPETYESNNFLVYDFETTNLSKGDPLEPNNRVVMSAWDIAIEQGLRNHVYGSEYDMLGLVKAIEEADFLVAHNAKFEAGWTRRCGINPTDLFFWDTMLAEYVLLGNTSKSLKDLSLDACCARRGMGQKENFVGKMIKGGVCPSEIPKSALVNYCHQDVALTKRLFLRQREEARELGLTHLIFVRCLLAMVLSEIESNGLCLDPKKVKEKYTEFSRHNVELDDELFKLTGGINMNSPKQVGEFLYDELGFKEPRDRRGNIITTSKGGRKADSETIAKLKPRNKRQRDFLSLKQDKSKTQAALSKNLEFFTGVCEERSNIFYGTFNQGIAKTHRLTSGGKPIQFTSFPKPKGVQFQNLPRAFKPLFTARHGGWSMMEADAAQLEFRVAAFLGQDTKAIEDIKGGFDVHSFSANIIGCSRQDAKAHTFKPLFGGKSGTPKQVEYYEAFAKKYSDITDAQDGWKDEVLKTKQLRTASGLIFYWPDTKMTSNGYITNSTNICNYPVQSLATAEIIPLAIICMYHFMKELGLRSYIVNTVHDSVICEVHPDEKDVMRELAEKSFTICVKVLLNKLYDIDFNVPLEADVEFSTHWGAH